MTYAPALLDEIRSKFANIDSCPITGERVFFENAGGALTLNSVIESTAQYAAIPDNQGRDNPASRALVGTIEQARKDVHTMFNASTGQVFVGESGTELLFRLIRSASVAARAGTVIGSTVEHPASRSAAVYWADQSGMRYISVAHDDKTGSVSADAYAALVPPDTRVATILHCSPVTGVSNDVGAIARAIRRVSPECFIIVDGIQFAAHGAIDVDDYGIDGYVISPYKVFSRHGYGIAWVSDRLGAADHERLIGGPVLGWELGTRDTGAYATFSQVVEYLDWIGSHFTESSSRRDRIEAAAKSAQDQERDLCELTLRGEGNLAGLVDLPGMNIVAGVDNAQRKGLVCFWKDGVESAEIVRRLNDHGVRAHVRKADHYSGNILKPLGQSDCVRISFCHYNSRDEVKKLLTVLNEPSQ